MNRGTTVAVDSLISREHQADRRAGENRRLLPGAECSHSLTVGINILLGGLDIPPRAESQRQIRFDLPLVLDIGIIFLRAVSENGAAPLRITVGNSQQEIGA